MSIRRPEPVRSLASIRTGETVVVECILFDTVRSRFETKGIRLGERLRCRDAAPGRLLLETARGAIVPVEQQWARFVQVVTPASSASSTDVANSGPVCA